MSADTPPQQSQAIQTPEPTGDDRYTDPLLDYIGSEVRVEWCDHEVEGVVVDIDLAHGPQRFEEQLIVETDAATLTVSPEDIIDA